MPRAALVLAGGRGRRLGGARKVTLDIAGRTPLDRVLAACADWPPVVVGPADLPLPAGVRLVTDDPPFGGPVSGLHAGLAALAPETDLVAVLAADQPFVTGAALERLAEAVIAGVPLNEAAGQLGIQLSTARTRLKTIQTKTGCHRQLDLVRMAMSVPSLEIE